MPRNHQNLSYRRRRTSIMCLTNQLPLQEAAKIIKTIGTSQNKSPISIVQELCNSRKITPKYEAQPEGPCHRITYTCKVKIPGFDGEGTGEGTSKQKSKQAAAKDLLNKLTENQVNENDLNQEEKEESDLKPANFENENPIGILMEICMPKYEDVREEGLPHERIYTVACNFFQYREEGSAKNKKIAKHIAASKILKKLEENHAI